MNIQFNPMENGKHGVNTWDNQIQGSGDVNNFAQVRVNLKFEFHQWEIIILTTNKIVFQEIIIFTTNEIISKFGASFIFQLAITSFEQKI